MQIHACTRGRLVSETKIGGKERKGKERKEKCRMDGWVDGWMDGWMARTAQPAERCPTNKVPSLPICPPTCSSGRDDGCISHIYMRPFFFFFFFLFSFFLQGTSARPACSSSARTSSSSIRFLTAAQPFPFARTDSFFTLKLPLGLLPFSARSSSSKLVLLRPPISSSLSSASSPSSNWFSTS